MAHGPGTCASCGSALRSIHALLQLPWHWGSLASAKPSIWPPQSNNLGGEHTCQPCLLSSQTTNDRGEAKPSLGVGHFFFQNGSRWMGSNGKNVETSKGQASGRIFAHCGRTSRTRGGCDKTMSVPSNSLILRFKTDRGTFHRTRQNYCMERLSKGIGHMQRKPRSVIHYCTCFCGTSSVPRQSTCEQASGFGLELQGSVISSL